MPVVVPGPGKQEHHRQHEPFDKCARPSSLFTAELVDNKVPLGEGVVTHGRDTGLG